MTKGYGTHQEEVKSYIQRDGVPADGWNLVAADGVESTNMPLICPEPVQNHIQSPLHMCMVIGPGDPAHICVIACDF